MEKMESKELLKDLTSSGLIVDKSEGEVLSFLEKTNKKEFFESVSNYTAKEKGRLLFKSGTTFSKLENDILFEDDLRSILYSSLFIVRNEIVNVIGEYVNYYNSVGRLNSGLFLSEKDYLIQSSYEIDLRDLVTDVPLFPSFLKEEVSSCFSLDYDTFISWVKSIYETFCRIEDGKKLLDYTFKNNTQSLKGSIINKKWSKRNMFGNILVAIDYLNSGYEGVITSAEEEQCRSLLSFYKIKEERLGLEKV